MTNGKMQWLVFHQISSKFISFFNNHGLCRCSSMHVWLVLVDTIPHCWHGQAVQLAMAREGILFLITRVSAEVSSLVSSIFTLDAITLDI